MTYSRGEGSRASVPEALRVGSLPGRAMEHLLRGVRIAMSGRISNYELQLVKKKTKFKSKHLLKAFCARLRFLRVECAREGQG